MGQIAARHGVDLTLVNGWSTGNIARTTTRHETSAVWRAAALAVGSWASLMFTRDMIESEYVAYFMGKRPLGSNLSDNSAWLPVGETSTSV